MESFYSTKIRLVNGDVQETILYVLSDFYIIRAQIQDNEGIGTTCMDDDTILFDDTRKYEEANIAKVLSSKI